MINTEEYSLKVAPLIHFHRIGNCQLCLKYKWKSSVTLLVMIILPVTQHQTV